MPPPDAVTLPGLWKNKRTNESFLLHPRQCYEEVVRSAIHVRYLWENDGRSDLLDEGRSWWSEEIVPICAVADTAWRSEARRDYCTHRDFVRKKNSQRSKTEANPLAADKARAFRPPTGSVALEAS